MGMSRNDLGQPLRAGSVRGSNLRPRSGLGSEAISANGGA